MRTHLPIFVMIRPRGGDFCYSETEFEQIRADLTLALELGADGLVLGLLLPNGTVDVRRTRQLVEQAGGAPVTFHRAFDATRHLDEALEAVIEAGCQCLLTSGGASTAPEGLDTLARLVKQAQGRIELMAGSGVNSQNAAALLKTGVQGLHLSGRSVRDSAMQFRKPELSMGGNAVFPEYQIAYADEAKIRAVVALAGRVGNPTA
jgi:copper homeostasis protein